MATRASHKWHLSVLLALTSVTACLPTLGYVLIDMKGIGKHNTRIPAETDMIFIPNFNYENGKELIKNNNKKFISLMLIFGQLKILQIILKRLQIDNDEVEGLEDYYFN